MILQALYAVQLNYMHVQQKKSVADKANFAALSKLPEIMVPKLTSDNDEIFTTDFCSVVVRTIGMNSIPVDYVMYGVTGEYDSPWTNQKNNINNCLLRTGDYFNNDNITLYLLYYHYIGNEGVGSNIINKYHFTKNGHKYTRTLSYNFGMMLI